MQLFRQSREVDVERGDAPTARDRKFSLLKPFNSESPSLHRRWLHSEESQVPKHEPSTSSQPSSSIPSSASRSSVLTTSTSLTQISSSPTEAAHRALKLAARVETFPTVALPADVDAEWKSKVFHRVQHECAQRIPDGRFSLHLWMSDINGSGMKPAVVYVAHLDPKYSFEPQRGFLLKKIEKKLRRLESLRLQDHPLLVHAEPAPLRGSLNDFDPETVTPFKSLGLPPTPPPDRALTYATAHDQGLRDLQRSSHSDTEPASDTRRHVSNTRAHTGTDSVLNTYTALPISFSGSNVGLSTIGGLVVMESLPYALTSSHALVAPVLENSTYAFSSLLTDDASVSGSEDDCLSEQCDASGFRNFGEEESVSDTGAGLDSASEVEAEIQAWHGNESPTVTALSPPDAATEASESRVIGTVYRKHELQQTAKSTSSDWAIVSLAQDEPPLPNTYINPDTQETVVVDSVTDIARKPLLVGAQALILAGRSGVQRAQIGRSESRTAIDGLSMEVTQLLLTVPLGEFNPA